MFGERDAVEKHDERVEVCKGERKEEDLERRKEREGFKPNIL